MNFNFHPEAKNTVFKIIKADYKQNAFYWRLVSGYSKYRAFLHIW